jgi:hypothetical protein
VVRLSVSVLPDALGSCISTIFLRGARNGGNARAPFMANSSLETVQVRSQPCAIIFRYFYIFMSWLCFGKMAVGGMLLITGSPLYAGDDSPENIALAPVRAHPL